MTDEIKAIIEKNLPAQVGENLKQVLSKGQSDAKLVEDQAAQILRLDREIELLKVRVSHQDIVAKREADVKLREDAATEKERNQKVFEAELKTAEAQKRSEELYGIVQMVFKSPVYRTATMGTAGGAYDAQGRYVNTYDNNKTEVKSVE